ncbi:lysyl oxidase family protein [Actinomadura sp. 6N118]|uniref:lysyl oxidase family protein n=1 Tax=Actinomadura sp. 6N118 TaxID=3375151 RepID=UPI00379EB136
MEFRRPLPFLNGNGPRPHPRLPSKFRDSSRIRAWRTPIIRSLRPAGSLTLAAGMLLLAAGGTQAATAAPSKPGLHLLVASNTVTLDTTPNSRGVELYLGTYLGATGAPFEIQVKRRSYGDPVVATQIIRQGGKVRTRTLPRSMVGDFLGLKKFLHVTLTDARGKKVLERDQAICPAGEGARTEPGGPSTSPYPVGCAGNPFTLGSVWGIQRGWAIPARSDENEKPVKLAVGTYTATVTINKAYRDLFGIPAKPRTVRVTVRMRQDDERPHPRKSAPTLRAASRPTGPNVVPKGPKPDLRSLPAWNIKLTDGRGDGHPAATKKDYLAFSANVWNAGPSPLVVDGFRVKQGLMDAYQYFYDAKGKQVGHAKTGTMEWDARDGHEHWHFTDFASYRLLKADKKEVVRSQKEAFCLANTDAINYLVKNANWKPGNTDLHSACGDLSSLSVREVLDVGSGDTYSQDLPGQSFDVTNLPNGTYYIQVIANPARRLFESDLKNNVALRKVILSGKPGARTVTVPPHQLVNAP